MEDDYWNNQPQLSESAGSINQPQLSQAVGLLNQPHLEYVAETPQSGMPSAQVVDPQSIGQSILLAYQRYLDSVVISEAENAPTFFCGPELATAGGSGSTIPDPRPSAALRDPRPSPALRDPRPSPALRDPRPSPTLRDPRPSPALRDPRPSPALGDPRPSSALRLHFEPRERINKKITGMLVEAHVKVI
nr:uncharacterized protein LOC104647222 [Solanum lycopersicum]